MNRLIWCACRIISPHESHPQRIRLEKNKHATVTEFVLDLRRIFSNCLQYNVTINDSFRPVARECLNTAEDLLTFFLAKDAEPTVLYPSLLYCWEDCAKVIDALYNLTNPDDGYQTAYFFMEPVPFYFGGAYPDGYLDKVKEPMDFGKMFISHCRVLSDECKSI